ncbi:hydrogenase formation protein HypD [Parabacteroides timonensis]|uniref:hydrogenase formation protein HypD n=1 Tax=Parabacteroides timonensis TaxID=1871013 RepID=UPI00094EE2A7|nr:hydrogenase formation protein HypD [Parabacteroides timonensis]
MKYVDEYRDNEQVQSLLRAIRKVTTQPWHIMEICGGQTHAIARHRLEELLPEEIRLLHGPGCPVCVTPVSLIDQALELAKQPSVILASFGDMMRVPGTKEDLLQAKAHGADVRMLYSPLDAVGLAEANPDKEIIFFAIGFETTAPVHMMALKEAQRRKLSNFSLLTSLFTVPPAMEAILSDPECKVDGFLTAGHVCAITGNAAYHRLAEKYKTPMVVTGFEPVDLLYGIYRCLLQLENGSCLVENAYKRVVPEEGNPVARALMDETLEPCDQEWRGIGVIPNSGLQLKKKYAKYSSWEKFPFLPRETEISSECIAGNIMRGVNQPSDCPFFGKTCSPEHPIGAPMVSSEGVCAAYYKYRKI